MASSITHFRRTGSACATPGRDSKNFTVPIRTSDLKPRPEAEFTSRSRFLSTPEMKMARTEQIRVLIVDDEPVARRGLRNHLKKAADVEVIGEAGNGRDAVETIIQTRPDLVFLDVQMPLLDGFRVIETLTEEHLPPAIVFVTAFDEHAIRAFEINALDYLLKPVDPKRLQKTLQRAREQIRSTRTDDRDQKLFALLRDLQSRKI